MMGLLLWLVNSGEEMVRGREGDREGGGKGQGGMERKGGRERGQGCISFERVEERSRRHKTEDRRQVGM